MTIRALFKNHGFTLYNISKKKVGMQKGQLVSLLQTRSNSESAIHTPIEKDDYGWFLPVQTRWKDNDCYGHMNNAVYHAIYDSIINIFLIRHCGLSIDRTTSSVVGFMVKTECKYTKPANYPAVYLSGLKIARIGNSSLTYHTAIFAAKNESAPFTNGDLVMGHFKDETNIKARVLDHFEDSSCCTGEYIHVFVNPNNGNKPCNISEEWRKVLKRLT